MNRPKLNPSQKIGVLFSGGLDSAALIGQLAKRNWHVWPIYISSGLPWEEAELYWAQQYLEEIHSPFIHELTQAQLFLEGAYEKNWSKTGKTPGSRSRDEAVFLPARNLLLITKALLALSKKNITTLALATLHGNPFADARKSYFQLLEKILSKSFNKKINLLTPFRGKTKVKILRAGKGLPLYLSLSCINPQGKAHCGKCNKCAERKRAFKTAGIIDRTKYNVKR